MTKSAYVLVQLAVCGGMSFAIACGSTSQNTSDNGGATGGTSTGGSSTGGSSTGGVGAAAGSGSSAGTGGSATGGTAGTGAVAGSGGAAGAGGTAECGAKTESGAVAWWKGEGNATDSIGAFDGTASAKGLSYAAGRVGQAFDLDGTDGYIEVPNGIISKMEQRFSVSAWFKPRAYPADTNPIFYGGATSGEYQLALGSQGEIICGIKLSTPTEAGWSDKWFLANSVNGLAAIDEWRMVTCVRDSTQLELWVDGQLQNTTTVPDSNLYVYAGFDSSIGTYDMLPGGFNGMIDEVVVYSRALTPSEIDSAFDRCK